MKYEKILNNAWEYLENNFKGSEINIDLWIRQVNIECDNNYCLKQCIKLLWSQWEWFDLKEKEYYRNYIRENYGVRLK
jgi:hypothetical protein